ncbi:MAG: hypothetical protein J6M24_05800 [Lachnospiraceae bacterium]|nr:hypothetical protein [Lachnospiraceae bacterium]
MTEGHMKEEKDEKKDYAIGLLRKKAEEIDEDRLPKKSDFSSEEVNLIKQKLGPWPRALEEAQLKEKPALSAAEKSRLKRERSKKAAKLRKRAEKNGLNAQKREDDK